MRARSLGSRGGRPLPGGVPSAPWGGETASINN